MPIASDWAPVMEFTAANIFHQSPLGDVLNSLRSLFLSGDSWPNYVCLEWEADDEELRYPPTYWKYALEAIIKVLLLYFFVHDNSLLFML